jgi:hypothetical protein
MRPQYRCRTHVRAHAGFHAIDYLEVSEDQRSLFLHFFAAAPTNLGPANIAISGGVRIRGIRAVSVTPDGNILRVDVDRPGDFSPYTLRIVKGPTDANPPADFDPLGAEVEFSFKVGCPSHFDCGPSCDCAPELIEAPEIDYLARDYATFRRLMLDRLSLVLPSWRERSPADVGIVLVELLAYVGDQLTYQQDAVATEAYLGTARRRTSVRRIARLLDYDMHDGCNARAWVQVRTKPGVTAPYIVPRRTLLCTRVEGRSGVIDPLQADLLAAQGVEFFETMTPLNVDPAQERMPFYTWGDEHCCLPAGATRATLKGSFILNKGTVLVLKEIAGPESGQPSDADPRHAHAVRLIADAGQTTDPIDNTAVTEIAWSPRDALPFPLCISATPSTGIAQPISVVLGNIVLADHGRTILAPNRTFSEQLPDVVAAPPFLAPVRLRERGCSDERPAPAPPRYAPRLSFGPVTRTARLARSRFAGRDDDAVPEFDATGPASAAFAVDPHTALPSVELEGGWLPRHDLLASGPFHKDFVVESEDDGGVTLRFGDDRHGKRPNAGDTFTATYRVGNGARGNVGTNAIGLVLSNDSDVVLNVADVTNPLPARGGIDPESLEDIRQKAPVAFRRQERAVTPADYAEVAERHEEVQRAAATFRWTGSWYTVFLTVDRRGGLDVDPPFETELRRHMERYRMAGYDLEVDAPRFVSLDIQIHVCVAFDFFRADVEAALLDAFTSGIRRDGQPGFFHPDRFSFGEPVYLSRVYAAAHAVPGVASVTVTRFERQGEPSTSALASGTLALQRLEIARLDNDPNFPDNGTLSLRLDGGR